MASAAIFSEPSHHGVQYELRNGTWTGRCDSLDVTITAASLDAARQAMHAAAKTALATTHRDAAGEEAATSVYAEQIVARRLLHQVLVGEVAGMEPARGPYVTAEGELMLRDSVVTVLDELGTTARWLNSLTDADLAARRALLDATRSALVTKTSANVESAVSYTDNVVHAMPFDGSSPAEALLYALPAPAKYQLELACQGVLLRGATALGTHHASPGLLIGQALIRAHELEADHAKFPRIILGEDAEAAAAAAFNGALGTGDVEYLQGLLLRDNYDKRLVINYLALPAVFESPAETVPDYIERHRAAIIAGLDEHYANEAVAKKWVWAADYHNHVVNALNLDASKLVPDQHSLGFGGHQFTTP